MVNNMNWLKERFIKTQYAPVENSGVRTTGIKIASGIVVIGPAANPHYAKNVSFGGFFSTGCQPIVTATWSSDDQERVFISIRGQASGNAQPNANGFTVVLHNDPLVKQAIHYPHAGYVHWIAVGY